MLSRQKKPLQLAAVLALPLLLIVWYMSTSGGWAATQKIVVNAISSHTASSSKPSQTPTPETLPAAAPQTYSQETFIKAMVEKPIPHDFNPKAVQEYCAKKTWPEDLVFYCHGIIGGIGSVRQQTLACVRWAMASGAALVIPRIRARQQTNSTLGEDVKHRYGGDVDPSHFFDKEGFRSAMHAMCPQMKLYDNSTLGELEGVDVKHIDDLGEFKIPDVTPWSEDLYRNTTEAFLRNHTSKGNGMIRYVWMGRHGKASRICDDGQDFANALGHLLPFRSDIVRIAASALYKMSTQYNVNINPKGNSAPGGFAGVHLRTASDATFFGWLSFEDQVAMYSTYLAKQPVPVIYVASGNLTSIELFADIVKPIPVVDKFSLLSAEDASTLRSMTWDQQGQVDFLVLTMASLFLGMVDSLFSISIASSRRAVTQSGTCGKVSEPEKGLTYNDGASIVVGEKKNDPFQSPMFFWP